jgi:hypothetical protein
MEEWDVKRLIISYRKHLVAVITAKGGIGCCTSLLITVPSESIHFLSPHSVAGMEGKRLRDFTPRSMTLKQSLMAVIGEN